MRRIAERRARTDDGLSAEALLEHLCTRRLDHARFPRLYVDATYVKRRVGGLPQFEAVVAVTGACADGDVEVVGVDVGDSEDEQFWHRLFDMLRIRGLHGVDEVMSGEDHAGLENALHGTFPGVRVVVSNDYPVIDLRTAIAVGEPTFRSREPSGPGSDRPPGSRVRRSSSAPVGRAHEVSAPRA